MGAGDALHSIYYMGESSISKLCRENLQKNWGPESWAHIRLKCKIPLSEIETREDLIKCFQSQIETGRSSIEFFKAEDGEGSLHLWRLKCCKKMMYRCPGLIKDYFVSNICSMKCNFAVDFRKSSHLLPYLLFSLDRLQCQNIKCPVCLSSNTWSEFWTEKNRSHKHQAKMWMTYWCICLAASSQ